VKAPVSGKSAALRWAQEREGQILAQKGRKPKEGKQVPTLAEFKLRFVEGYVRANRLKPSTAEAYESVYRTYLLPTFGSRRLDAIGDELVQRLKGELVGEDLANKTVNNVLSALSVTLKQALEWKVIETMPCRIRLLRWEFTEIAFYDFAEYRYLVEAATAIDPRIGLLVLLGGDAGQRRGEALALEWTDVDLRRRSMHVQRSSWNGHVTLPKGGRSRRLPLTERLCEALKAHRHLQGPRVLYCDDGTSPTNKVVRKWMERAQRRAMLPATGAYHILRHTFCSHLAMQGATAKAIQELAGHQDLTTTQRYMHLSPAHKDAAIRLLDRRPVDERVVLETDDHISRIKMGADGAPAPTGTAETAEKLGDGLETSLRPEPEVNHLRYLRSGGAGNRIPVFGRSMGSPRAHLGTSWALAMAHERSSRAHAAHNMWAGPRRRVRGDSGREAMAASGCPLLPSRTRVLAGGNTRGHRRRSRSAHARSQLHRLSGEVHARRRAMTPGC
jgi:integrase